MVQSEAEICNQALLHLGNTKTITDLENDRSVEAKACRVFYEQDRDEVLRDFAWPFAKRIAAFALVATDPVDDWGYSYRLPADYLALREIGNGFNRVATPDTREPFVIASDATGGLLYVDVADATVEYTARIEDVAQFPPDFVRALALKLASDIAPAVTGGDEFNLGEKALAKYFLALRRAEVNALNEQAPDVPPDADLVRVRG